jgi:uncharacterized protein
MRFALKKNRNRKIPGLVLAGLAAAGVLVLAYARAVEPASLEITRQRVRLPRLHPSFDGYRIVQISDIHMDGWMNRKRLREIVHIVNQERPDLVVVTGDFVSRHARDHAPALIEELQELRANDGVAAVLGNHDHWCDPELVRQIIRASGMRDLNNRVCSIHKGPGSLHIAGVDDFMEGQDDLEQVLSDLPEEGAAILLSHEPDFADLSAQTGRFDLQLSGHSHGGQINLPIIGPPYLPEHARKYPDGLYHFGDMLLYTNRGLGMVHLPLRLNSIPEITVFTLESKRLS